MAASRHGTRPGLRRCARIAALVVVTATALVGVGTHAAGAAVRVDPARSSEPSAPRSRFVEVPEAPGGAARIRIDTDLYLPAAVPAPAVLLAHGFGQDKHDLAPEAKRLQSEGYVVLAYSARGFGRSTGRIGLDSLAGEVPDARALVDVLARDEDVLNRHGDPVVGVVGASYGGALALMLGATDPRIDSVVAGITWNDLAQALDPESAGWTRGSPPERVFKSGWASLLFGTGAVGSADPCSRFTAQLCTLYRKLITGGSLSSDDLALLRSSSPSSVLSGMTAPTLLIQGLQDSLFGLDQADANRREIRKAGADVGVDWFDGGHDSGGAAGTEQATDDWLAATLMHRGPRPKRFSYDVPASPTFFPAHHTSDRYPGLRGTVRPDLLRLTGPAKAVVNPPGGEPTSVTSLPGIGVDSSVGIAADGLLAPRNPPGQAARFVSAPLGSSMVLAGSAGFRMRVTPVSPVRRGSSDVVLFGQLIVLTGRVSRALPGGVAPIHVEVPADGATVYVSLPATTWQLAAGDRLALTVRTTDSQFLGSRTPASFLVSADGLLLPRLTAHGSGGGIGQPSRTQLQRIGLLIALLLVALIGPAVLGRRRMRTARRAEESVTGVAAPPLVLRGVTKRFGSGFVAVDDISFAVERGQVLGLLGENGAGKTTTIRMVLGLSRPDAGTIEAFGVPIVPGAPVLRRIGCFVEGPGFLPNLSGRSNLRLFWAATGRPRRDAHLDEVLAIADLGPALRRRVGGYSQGMRQRLALAQAMLGMPDLLVLDEPANGLDPPQIVALRGVLRRYAEAGRTVIVSSHLLSEVERTCSHLVVLSRGRLLAAGPVADVAGGADELVVEVDDPERAVGALEALGVDLVEPAGEDAVRVRPGAIPTAAVVTALVDAGVGVTDISRARHLEDAFLALIGEGPMS
jgi:ABC-2 type transport system ATP-binding protein